MLFRWSIAIIATLLLHMALLMAPPIPSPTPPAPKSTPVKFTVRLVPKKPAAQTAPTKSPAKQPGASRRKPLAPGAAGGTLAYKNLLPTADADASAQFQVHSQENKSGSKWQSDETTTKVSGAVVKFAELVDAAVDVPQALRTHFASGKAQVFIKSQSDGAFVIKRASGEPYFRALLFDRIKELIETNGNTDELTHEGVDSVTVRLEFKKVIVRNGYAFHGHPFEIRVTGNDITLAYLDIVQDPKWAMFGVAQDEHGKKEYLFNILAPIAMLQQYLSPPEMEGDMTLKNLRTSPAFVKPIK